MKEKIRGLIDEEKIKKFMSNRFFNFAVIFAVLIIAVYVLWSSLISPYINRKNLIGCLKEAYAGLDKEHKAGCILEEKEIGSDGLCILSTERVNKLSEQYNIRRDECLTKYPAKY
jgi:hypothetical protein